MQVLSSIFKGLGRLFLQPIFLIVLLVFVSAGGIYLAVQNKTISQELSTLQDTPEAKEQAELVALVEEIGKLTELPEGEAPTIATVTDVESIREQSFFRNAQNGDRVLIYAEARRAILYRPSSGKIIEVAPINIGQAEGLNQDQQGTSSDEQTEGQDSTEVSKTIEGPVRLGLSNSTSTAGLTVTASKDLEEKITDFELDVVSRTDAEGSYDDTIVVVLSEGYEGVAKAIATAVGGSVGELPEGENTPDADVLVILGSSYISN